MSDNWLLLETVKPSSVFVSNTANFLVSSDQANCPIMK